MKSSYKKLFFILITLCVLGFAFKYAVSKGMRVDKIFGFDLNFYKGKLMDSVQEQVEENVMIVDSLRQIYS